MGRDGWQYRPRPHRPVRHGGARASAALAPTSRSNAQRNRRGRGCRTGSGRRAEPPETTGPELQPLRALSRKGTLLALQEVTRKWHAAFRFAAIRFAAIRFAAIRFCEMFKVYG